jgi:hypothetical protein
MPINVRGEAVGELVRPQVTGLRKTFDRLFLWARTVVIRND